MAIEQDILFKFTAETQDLDVLKAKYESLENSERDLQAEIKKLSYEYQKNAQVISFYAKTSEEIEKKQAALFVEKSRKEKQWKADLKSTQGQMEQLDKSIKNIEANVAKNTISQTMVKQLRSLKEEVRQMEAAGDTTSQRFIDMSVQAGKLQDQIGDTNKKITVLASDTKNLNAAMSIGQGLTGTFTAATNTMALLGVESKALQDAFYKTQAAMSLLNSVQMIANTVNKDSAANIVIKNALAKVFISNKVAETATTTAHTAATATETTIVKGATIAQNFWNKAILANPALWLVAGIMGIVTAVSFLVSSYETEEKKQKKLSEIEKERLIFSQKLIASRKESQKENINELEYELEIAKARGASIRTINDIEIKIAERRVKDAKDNKEFSKQEVDNIEVNKKKLLELEEIRSKGLKISRDWTGKVKVEVVPPNERDADKYFQALDRQIENLSQKVKIGAELKFDFDDMVKKQNVLLTTLHKQNLENYKKNTIAELEARLIEQKKGSEAELNTRKELIKTKLGQELAIENLTAGEIKKIRAQANAEIRVLNYEFTQSRLQDELTFSEAALIITKKGTEEQQRAMLDIEQAIYKLAIANKNLTDAEKILLELQHEEKVLEIKTSFEKQASDNEITRLQGRLFLLEKGSEEEYSLRLEFLQKQYELEIAEAERLGKDKSAIEAKYSLSQKEALKDKLSHASSLENQNLEEYKLQQQRMLINENSTFAERKKAQKNLSDFKLMQLKIEAAQIEDQYKAGILMDQEYRAAIMKNAEAQNNEELKTIENKEAIRKELFEKSVELILSIADSLYGSKKQKLQGELDDLDQFYTSDAEEARKNTDKKYISEKQLKEKKLQIKKEIAKAEKEEAIFKVIISTAMSIAKSSELGFPLAIPFIALAAAMGAIQIATIASQPLPKYWKGRKGGKGEMAEINEQGREIVWLPDGASVIPAHKSQKVNEALDIMRDYNIPTPNIPTFVGTSSGNIDYSKLGQEIGKHIKNNSVSISMDEEGFKKSLTKGNLTQNSLNTLFKSNL